MIELHSSAVTLLETDFNICEYKRRMLLFVIISYLIILLVILYNYAVINLVVCVLGGGEYFWFSCGFSCWFFLNNSETMKAVTLAFCSISWFFISDIPAKFGIPNLPHLWAFEKTQTECSFGPLINLLNK